MGKQRPVQVVRDHDRAEALALERPGIAVFEVCLHETYSLQMDRRAIHRDDLQISFLEKSCMSSLAASQIEHRPAYDARGPAHHPLGRREVSQMRRSGRPPGTADWRRARVSAPRFRPGLP